MSMIESGSAAFLQQAQRNNWQKYLVSLKPNAPGGWDLCVLTASDQRQATTVRRQLALRKEAGLLPLRTRFLVIADPAGQRIGSGGATLRVLAMLAEGSTAADVETVKTGRILIIHSGGDSRRLPHCSAIGKLFARIPRTLPDGRASTILDEFLISLSALAVELPSGVLVASGDVLLIFDHLQLSFQRPGVTGVAAAAPAETGTRHGVYASDGRHDLRAYLHKPSIERLQTWDAIESDGTVAIDTGLVWLDTQTAGKLVELAQEEAVARAWSEPADANSQVEGPRHLPLSLNLYGDLLMPLAGSTTLDGYLADTSDGPDTPTVRRARQVIWEHLRGVPFTVERLQPAVFVHFGTSSEYWTMVADSAELARTCSWASHTASWLSEPARQHGDGLALINAVVEDEVTVESRSGLIVDAHLAGPLALKGAALIAGVRTERPLTLGPDIVLHQLPVNGGFVTRVFGLTDNPKRPWDDPGATVMNRPWRDWLSQAGVDRETVWPDVPPAERTLWNARLYPLVPHCQESLALSLPLHDPAGAPRDWRAKWEACPRLSLAESFARADSERILAEMVAIEDEVAAQHFYSAIQAEQPAAEAKSLLGPSAPAVDRRLGWVATRLEHDDSLLQLRGYKALAEATGDLEWEDRAFATLAKMIEMDLPPSSPPTRRGEQMVQVAAAARIDFGGGWTDTPPYSLERGGTVLNAAITLHGRHPITAEAEWSSEPRLILESRDGGVRRELIQVGEVLTYANPADPLALLKAALVLRGIVHAEEDPNRPLAKQLQTLGGGLHLRTQTNIPRGSGLGTSSIMAGAVLACLGRLIGLELTQARLFGEVLCLEQMLTTGGGWQDQVGGLVGGIKLVTTAPGLPQQIQVKPVRRSPTTKAELSGRLVLVYTGQQRLAKNLLRAVMGRWLARDPEMVWIQKEIARLALAMRDALESGDISGFGALLGEHWTLNKRMDPGCTNPFIDGLFETMAPYINGGKLAGAGGGGFAIVVARDQGAAADLSAALETVYPGTPVAIWPCAVPADGIV
jgi:fucokinase